jgi:hypothetical protein
MPRGFVLSTDVVAQAFVLLESRQHTVTSIARAWHCEVKRLRAALRTTNPARYLAIKIRQRQDAQLARYGHPIPPHTQAPSAPSVTPVRVKPPRDWLHTWEPPAPRPAVPAMRLCLGWCDTEFWSSGPGHRFCQKCKERLAQSPQESTRGRMRGWKEIVD